MIHKDNIIFHLCCQLQCLTAGHGGIYCDLRMLQQSGYDHQIHFHIIHDQNSCCWRDQLFLLLSACLSDFHQTGLKISYRCPFSDCLGNPYGKCRSLTIDTINMDGSSHHFHQIFRKIESQPGSFDIPVPHFIQAGKAVKNLADVFCPDTDSGIGYGNQKYYRGISPLFHINIQRHTSL